MDQNGNAVNYFTNSFYSPVTVNADIHNRLVGRAELQNGAGSNKIEVYFKYDSVGSNVERKNLHNGLLPTAVNTFDSFGNVLTTTDPLGRVTTFTYNSTSPSRR